MYNIKTSKFIGEKIKHRRRELGMTQEELAEKIGVTYQQVQRYENGSNKLNVEQIQNIALYLDVPVKFFFYTDNDCLREDCHDYLSMKDRDKEYEKAVKYVKRVKTKKYKRLYLEFIKLILEAERA